MISGLTIADLRGVHQGTVEGLKPLTVLAGVNGSGKSTILDALLIGTAAFPATVIGQAIKRRASRQFTGEWLFHRRSGRAVVEVNAPGSRITHLRWLNESEATNWGEGSAFGGVEASFVKLGQTKHSTVRLLRDGREEINSNYDANLIDERARPPVRLIDMRGIAGSAPDLTDVLTDAKSRGRATAVVDLLGTVVPGLRNLEILRVGDGFEVGLILEQAAVPLSMSGDGIRGVARMSLELAAADGGLALLEEPEVHQHPAALRQSALAIVAAVKRGLQVVLTTHSLELVDQLLSAASSMELLGSFGLQRVRLDAQGTLSTVAFEGAEVQESRQALELELR